MALSNDLKKQFNKSSDKDLELHIMNYGNREEGLYCSQVLRDRRINSQINSLDEINKRLLNVERITTKPEYHTWAFWLAIVAITIAFFSLLYQFP